MKNTDPDPDDVPPGFHAADATDDQDVAMRLSRYVADSICVNLKTDQAAAECCVIAAAVLLSRANALLTASAIQAGFSPEAIAEGVKGQGEMVNINAALFTKRTLNDNFEEIFDEMTKTRPGPGKN